MSEIKTFSQAAYDSLAGSHYQKFYGPGLESQFQPTTNDDVLDRYGDPAHPPYKWRLPDDQKNGVVVDNDKPMDYPWGVVGIWGTSWWDYKNKVTLGCMFDIDFGHGAKVHTAEEIADWDQRVASIPYLMNSSSKGSHGRHGNVFLETPLAAAIPMPF